jgi:hypothetical protein
MGPHGRVSTHTSVTKKNSRAVVTWASLKRAVVSASEAVPAVEKMAHYSVIEKNFLR